MVLRNLPSQLLLAGLLVGPAGAAETTHVDHPTLTFFSSVSEEPLALLEAESIGPRFVKHGPFRMPAPGVAVEAPVLTLHDQPCTRDDWSRVLRELGRFQGAPGGIQFLVTLPDGRGFVFQRPPSTSSGMLSGLVRPLNPEKGKTADPRLLRITHDGRERLRVDLRALPAVAARPAPPETAEPEPDSEAPSPPAAFSSSSESDASP